MRLLKTLSLVVLACGISFAQSEPQKSIQVSDMDRKADPCNDFYQYANGAWRAANPIPASMPRWSRRWQAGENNKEYLKNILQELSAKTDWRPGSVEQISGDFYASCMDEAKINKLGMTPIKPLLNDIDAMKTPADVMRMITRFNELGISIPFALFANSDYHNPSQVIADIGASGLGLPDRDYYLKPDQRFKDTRAKYLEHVTNMFKLAGYPEPKAKAAAQTVFDMETKLAENSLDNVALRDPKATDHKMALADLQKMTPNFNWTSYLKTLDTPNTDVNVQEPKFMAEFNRQLAQTPVDNWKTYLKWHLMRSASNSLSEPFVVETFNFYSKYLNGAQEMRPRWKRCAESADQLIGEAVGQPYVKKYFPPEAKARMQDLVKNLLAAMKDTIDGLEWMSPDTKKKALEKLATFNPKIGYPDKWKDYSSVKITRDSYWDNVVAGRRFVVRDDHSQIGKPVDRGRWGMTPPTSDAYYNPLLNEIVFPAGILQPPAFDLNAVDAVNYGAIGVVIGHEISHGFDDQGAQYDAQGRLQNWWTEADLKNFQQRGQCVVDQFDNYFIEPNIHHNGKLVLGEAIGDLAGAKLAYLAYKKAQEKTPAPVVDGFTPDQQFFIAWGQFRGDEIRPETQRMMIQGDPHPIAKYRVIGPLSNLPQFQQAFQCKGDAAMVRPAAKRCEVW